MLSEEGGRRKIRTREKQKTRIMYMGVEKDGKRKWGGGNRGRGEGEGEGEERRNLFDNLIMLKQHGGKAPFDVISRGVIL